MVQVQRLNQFGSVARGNCCEHYCTLFGLWILAVEWVMIRKKWYRWTLLKEQLLILFREAFNCFIFFLSVSLSGDENGQDFLKLLKEWLASKPLFDYCFFFFSAVIHQSFVLADEMFLSLFLFIAQMNTELFTGKLMGRPGPKKSHPSRWAGNGWSMAGYLSPSWSLRSYLLKRNWAAKRVVSVQRVERGELVLCAFFQFSRPERKNS